MIERLAARSSLSIAVARLAAPVLLLSSCTPLTEVVLVVDTDMAVPADLDHIRITVEGTQTTALDVNLVGAGAATFPVTLGLVRAGAANALRVTVDASLQDSPVLSQTARTTFLSGSVRLLRMVLSVACLPVTCDTTQTCDSGTCGPIDRTASALPPWTGVVPPSPAPPDIVPIVGQSVWASGWHSAASEGTTLYAWGENSDGQLGTGNTQNAKTRRPVTMVQAPLSVGLGQKHSCICNASRQAFCWGRNADGQLGIGNTTPKVTPVAVPGIDNCVQIAGADRHTCVIRVGGAVSCWGNNSWGQLGQSLGPGTGSSAPVPVTGLTDPIQIGCGDRFTCALLRDMTVWCWGDNSTGQLGDGTLTAHAVPAPVTGLTDAVEIAVGRTHVCARHQGGTLSCWGANTAGQLGNGALTSSNTAVAVPGVTDAAQVVAGHSHSCVLSNGTRRMSCWGGNTSGQLGIGVITTAPSTAPVTVLGIYEVTSMAAGSEHTCARHANGSSLSCWGDNFVNQLGDGSTTNRSNAVSVAGF